MPAGGGAGHADTGGDRRRLLVVGMAAVWVACTLFAIVRLAVAAGSGDAALLEVRDTGGGIPDGMNGVELAGRLKAATPGLRVILRSGYSEDPSLRVQAGQGEVRFLQKPFDLAAPTRELAAAFDEA